MDEIKNYLTDMDGVILRGDTLSENSFFITSGTVTSTSKLLIDE